MGGRPPAWKRGVTKLEFAVVVALFGILAALLLDRLTEIERQAERLEVDLTVRHIRVGMQLAVGEKLMRGEEDRLGELLTASPVDFLGRKPEGWQGEGAVPARPGAWCFDPVGRVLAYRPRQPEVFGGRQELRWRLVAQREAGGSQRFRGFRLEAVEG